MVWLLCALTVLLVQWNIATHAWHESPADSFVPSPLFQPIRCYFISVCVCAYIFTRTCLPIYVWYGMVYMCVCVFIYVRVHTHAHTRTYISRHRARGLFPPGPHVFSHRIRFTVITPCPSLLSHHALHCYHTMPFTVITACPSLLSLHPCHAHAALADKSGAFVNTSKPCTCIRHQQRTLMHSISMGSYIISYTIYGCSIWRWPQCIWRWPQCIWRWPQCIWRWPQCIWRWPLYIQIHIYT